ncbi:hypothetical protein [Empedobacter brevis]|uniref:hypothetical protein n=1 Tax=Empedobacter brevis TaxID=247 RepID=UPI0028992D74|nr:hypothetical protein [Empedobacter brevis]
MKTKLLLLVLLGWVGIAWGQVKYDSVHIINLSQDMKIPTLVKKNTFVGFKIENVNVFKVKGTTLIKTADLEYSTPKWVSDIMEKEDNEGKEETVHGFSPLEREPTEQEKLIIEFQNAKKSVQQDIVSFYANYQNIKKITELQDRLNFILSDSIFINKEVIKPSGEDVYKSIYGHIVPDFKDYQKIDENILRLQSNYINILNNYTYYEKLVIQLKYKTEFQSEIEEIKQLYAGLQKTTTSVTAKAKNGIDFYRKIRDSKFEISLPPQQLTNDVNTITPQLKNEKGKVVYEYNPLIIQTYGGWKINFSAGYFLSFIGNDNYTSYTNALGNKEVAKGNTDKITNALGGLMHVYSNQPGWLVQPGFSFGISLADNSSAGFYGGASLFFLEKNRLVTTFGYSFIKVKSLNTANLTPLSDSDSYAFTNMADTEIRYDNIYKGAWFFGVTYNLSNNNTK